MYHSHLATKLVPPAAIRCNPLQRMQPYTHCLAPSLTLYQIYRAGSQFYFLRICFLTRDVMQNDLCHKIFHWDMTFAFQSIVMAALGLGFRI